MLYEDGGMVYKVKRSLKVESPALPKVEHLCDFPATKIDLVFHLYKVGKIKIVLEVNLRRIDCAPSRGSQWLSSIQEPGISIGSNGATYYKALKRI